MYKCKFNNDDEWDKDVEYEYDVDSQRAAENYAEYAFYHRDMWEVGNNWTDDLSILVLDEGGNIHRFNIVVETFPTFHATETEVI